VNKLVPATSLLWALWKSRVYSYDDVLNNASFAAVSTDEASRL